MYTRFLSIADFNIVIRFHHTYHEFRKKKIIDDVDYYFRPFIQKSSRKQPDFIINFIKSRTVPSLFKPTNQETYIQIASQVKNNTLTTNYLISVFQLTYLLRDILIALLARNRGFTLHSSGSKIRNSSYIFLGKEGAGKSTIASLLSRKYATLTDDITIIRPINDIYYAYHNPFNEKKEIKKNKRKYKLAGVFVIRKSQFFEIKPIDDKTTVAHLLTSQLITDPRYQNQNMNSLLKFVQNYSNFFVLRFAKHEGDLLRLFDKFSNSS